MPRLRLHTAYEGNIAEYENDLNEQELLASQQRTVRSFSLAPHLLEGMSKNHFSSSKIKRRRSFDSLSSDTVRFSPKGMFRRSILKVQAQKRGRGKRFSLLVTNVGYHIVRILETQQEVVNMPCLSYKKKTKIYDQSNAVRPVE